MKHFLIAASLVVSLIFITVSWFQAYDFMITIYHGEHKEMLVGALVLGILCLGLLISAWLKFGTPKDVVMAMGVIMIIAVETYSIGTSTIALNNKINVAERSQNTESAEYRSARDRVVVLTNQINTLERRVNALPSNYHDMSNKMTDKLMAMNEQLASAQYQLNNVQVSTVGQTFDTIQSMIGLRPEHLTTLAAILFSAGPHILIALCIGSWLRQVRRPN